MFAQEYSHTCLPACIRIVLAYRGKHHSETELAKICRTVPVWGTSPAMAVDGLEEFGYRALWFENATLERLFDLLAQDWPVIVFLRATDIPHGRAGLHAVVVSEWVSGEFLYVDPAQGEEKSLPLDDFIRAWATLGNQGMVVWLPVVD
ncbi:C39 family peptidase [Anaerolineales bacterium HSG25]|nr:C39 family peptidase [Anaerolineales bacterium HSG25]